MTIAEVRPSPPPRRALMALAPMRNGVAASTRTRAVKELDLEQVRRAPQRPQPLATRLVLSAGQC